MPLLSKESLAKVKDFRYQGSDTSPIYKYLLSPFAQFCVDKCTPLWMAPNMITLIGLSSSFISTALVLVYNPTLGLNGPRWLSLFVGFGIFFYQTLDNMDGKQARRTGSSSALGMLFDHGCDAINAGLCAIPMGSVLGTGWTVSIFFTLWCGFVPFYFQTWEEYYLGAMNLPPINGPSEGLLIAVFMCFCSYFYGSQFWHEVSNIPLLEQLWSLTIYPFRIIKNSLHTYICFQAPFSGENISNIGVGVLGFPLESLSRFQFLVIAGVLGALVTVIIQTFVVLSKLKQKGESVVDPVLNLLPFLVFLPSSFLWCLYSDIALSVHPIATLLLISSTFTEMVSHIMLMHICDDPLSPWGRATSFLIAILPIHVFLTKSMASNDGSVMSSLLNKVNEAYLLQALAVLSLLVTSSKLYMVSNEQLRSVSFHHTYYCPAVPL